MSEVVKKFMYLNRKAPYGTIYAWESLEVVLVGAAFDQEVSLMFVDDGVYQLVKGQDTAGIGMKNFSPTYRTLGDYEVKYIYGVLLSGANHRQFWVPAGFAHGYYVTGQDALFSYKCSDYYHPENELSVAWNDPAIGIDWPLTGEPILSAKDMAAIPLAAIPADHLPPYAPH